MVNPSDRKVDALIFDKDGTLFDFHATWSTAFATLIEELAEGDPARRSRLADSLHFDLNAGLFHPTSPVIAGTNRQAAEYAARALPERNVDDVERQMEAFASDAPLVPAVPLVPLMQAFLDDGLQLGVMTNDSEVSARANLRSAGIHHMFAMVIGFDSGFGAKPAPDPLLAFSNATGITPARCAMVGDSIHDLISGRAAGMQTIAVLTGVADAPELHPYADIVLDHVGQIPDWLTK